MSATETVQPTPFDDAEPQAGASLREVPAGAPEGPDPRAVQRILDGDYAEVRDLVRENLVTFADILTDAETLSTDDYRDKVRDLLLEMADSGQTGMGFPEEYGGGGDVGASIAAFETLAFGDLSVLVKAGVQFGLFGGAILHLGTKHHHDAYLRKVISGELLGGFAMSESGHGSNVQALRTHATYDAEAQEFVIDTDGDLGRKDYIGNAARHGTVAVVFAQLHVGEGEDADKGVHAFVVPIRGEDGEALPGVRIEDCGHKMGLNGVDNGRLWFDGVRVPRTALLDRLATVTPEGNYQSSISNPDRRFFTTLGTLVQGRVSVGGAGINASKVAITLAVRYADLRRQFEATDPEREQLLLDYGMHQRRLLPLLARTYALHFAQEKLAGELHLMSGITDDEARQRELESRAAGTKALGTWHATRTIQEAREACGGAGYLSANRLGALKADTDVFTTFEGDNHVLLQLVAKGLLTGYASEFEDMNQLDMARFVGELAVATIVERTAVHKLLERVRDVLPGGEDWATTASLRDPDYQRAMLRFREEHLVSGVARRLKRGIDAGYNPGAVFSRAQDHVIAAARAHVERLVLEDFAAKVDSLPPGAEKDALVLLRDLHALAEIERDRAWFIEHGRLSVARSKAITREVGELCRLIRPIAVPLVDAFGIPEEMLRSRELLDPAYLSETPTR